MYKRHFTSSLFCAALSLSTLASGSVNIAQYRQPGQVSAILNDREVTAGLQALLGDDYDAFIGNFDLFGEPHQTADGGLFVEGWLKDLYLENASAFVIYPDGKFYAAWVMPDEQFIHYQPDAKNGAEIPPDIKTWASRFENASFPTISAAPVSPLAREDFSTQISNTVLSLGQNWNPQVSSGLGKSLQDDFAGDVPFDGANYKFYRHTYNGFDIYSANLWWDKAERDVDDYIIAQITLHTPQYKTWRGVSVGATADEIARLYGPGKRVDEDGEQWLSYAMGKKVISFEIDKGKVVSITLSYDNGE